MEHHRTLGRLFVVVTLLFPCVSSGTASETTPPAWSPAGDWIAYVVEGGPIAGSPLDSWIFRGRGEIARRPDAPPRRATLWATTAEAPRRSVAVLSVVGSITPPSWKANGLAMVAGRLVAADRGEIDYRVLIFEGEAEPRVVFSQTYRQGDPDADGLEAAGPCWSPDGLLIAVPRVHPRGLSIVRAEDGSIARTIPFASRPAWSSGNGRLLYVVSGDVERLESVDARPGAPRRIATIDPVVAPLVIDRDGLSAVVTSRPGGNLGGRYRLDRVRLDDGRKSAMPIQIGGPTSALRPGAFVSFDQDREGEDLFSVASGDAAPAQVSWYRVSDRSPYKNFAVLDVILPVGGLSLNPSGNRLAARVGRSGATSLPVLCDLDTMAFSAIAADAAIAGAWVDLLSTSIETILRPARPVATLKGRAIDRPVALPIPGEVDPESDPAQRVARLARVGLGLLNDSRIDRPEARFLFDYLVRKFAAAEADLTALDRLAASPADRLKLLAIRGEVYAGLGDLDRAGETFRYLQSIEARAGRSSIETTSRGRSLQEIDETAAGWPDYALARLEILRRTAAEPAPTGGTARPKKPNDLPLGLDEMPPPFPR